MILEDIKKRNEDLIIKYVNDKENLYRQNLIKNLLGDNNCFFKISIEEAYSILTDLEYNENEVKDIYMKLISYNNF